MRLGFIGTGAITSALVTGLCTTARKATSIWLSPRNEETAKALAHKFDRVHIGSTNQEVLHNSDIIILAILPQLKKEILSALKFKEGHRVVSLLAATPVSDVEQLVVPAQNVTRVIPLPCAAKHIGPIAMYPQDAVVHEIFDPLGTVIVVDHEQQLDTLMWITALMAPYYALLETIVSWAVEAGVDRKDASDYAASMFAALSTMAAALEGGELDRLVKESMTPGGLNELALNTINKNHGFENIVRALRAVQKEFGM